MLWITRMSSRISTLAVDWLVAPVYAIRRGLFWAIRPRLSLMRLRDAVAFHRSRRQLASLDPRLRTDLGLDGDSVRAISARPALTQLSPWALAELRQSVEEAQSIGGQSIGGQSTGRHLPNTPAANPSFYQARGRTGLTSPICHP
jgi:uncharacterized protein YjiS (DUF1127 family)